MRLIHHDTTLSLEKLQPVSARGAADIILYYIFYYFFSVSSIEFTRILNKTCKSFQSVVEYKVKTRFGKDFLKNTVSGMSYTGSYWLSAVPFAAGIACINKMKRMDLPRLLNEKGIRLRDGLMGAAKKYGFDLRVSGAPSLFYLRVADDPTLMLHQEWIAECVKRGVFFTNHHNHFINASLSDEDIRETVEIADEAFSVLRERHDR